MKYEGLGFEDLNCTGEGKRKIEGKGVRVCTKPPIGRTDGFSECKKESLAVGNRGECA